jgi:DNA helicase-2/ATP-dependent DNA helicase PcrA
VITRRVAYLLHQGIPGRNILALTFTNKAAGEMKERIHALAPASGVWVGTFHGVCARLLRTYAPLVGLDRGFTIYDQADRLRTIRDVMRSIDLEGRMLTPERAEAAISRSKNELVSPGRGGAWTEDETVLPLLDRVYQAYQERLRACSAVDFDDLLLHIVAILKSHGDVRGELDRRFRFVLVDEYQDTNLAQYAIVRALSVDNPNLCATGDPDQSIYGWRGANLGNILEFEHDFPGCRVVKLERNYRSTKNILQVGDHLIRHNRMRKPKALETENERGLPVILSIHAEEKAEARAVASKISELAREGTYSYREIAVFCRVMALTAPLESAFRMAGIPYQVVGGFSFYERQEVKDVLAYLNLLANPRDDLSFLRVVNLPPRGLGKTSLDFLVEHAKSRGVPLMAAAQRVYEVPGLKPAARTALKQFVALVSELRPLLELTAEEAIRQVLTRTGYRAHIARQGGEGNEDRLASVDEMLSEARRFDEEQPGSSLIEFLESTSLTSGLDGWNAESGAVALMSLHAAKGLEFPVVFIVGLEQGLLPHVRSSQSEAELEEERRLFFVGITRAKRELYLSRCMIRSFRGQTQGAQPSQFLRELPDEPMEIHDLSEFSTSGSFTGMQRAPELYGAGPSRFGSRLTTAASLAPGSSSITATGVNLSAFQPGVRVLHPDYGPGRIIAIDGAGPDRKGRVAFASGEKTFVLSRSPLKPLGGR